MSDGRAQRALRALGGVWFAYAHPWDVWRCGGL